MKFIYLVCVSLLGYVAAALTPEAKVYVAPADDFNDVQLGQDSLHGQDLEQRQPDAVSPFAHPGRRSSSPLPPLNFRALDRRNAAADTVPMKLRDETMAQTRDMQGYGFETPDDGSKSTAQDFSVSFKTGSGFHSTSEVHALARKKALQARDPATDLLRQLLNALAAQVGSLEDLINQILTLLNENPTVDSILRDLNALLDQLLKAILG